MSREVEFEGPSGLRLSAEAHGDAGRPTVLLLHGGGQTRHAWGRTGEVLERAGYHAVALDARGHGRSARSPEGNYGLPAFADDLRTVIATYPTPPAVVGASLGGLTALVAQAPPVRAPMRLVVIVDVAPMMETAGVSRILSFMRAHVDDGFATIEEAAEAVAAFLPHRPKPRDLSGLRKNLRLEADGRYRWHWDPRFLEWQGRRDSGFSYEGLSEAARAVTVPTLLVRGGLSDVLSEDAAADFRRLVPHSEYANVAEAAHMIAGDRNDLFCEAVVEFLGRHDPP